MIYDLLDLLEEFFLKIINYCKKNNKRILIFFICFFISFFGNLIFFLKNEKIRLLKEDKLYQLWFFRSESEKNPLYIMNYDLKFSENFEIKRYLIGRKLQIKDKDIFFILITNYKVKNVYAPNKQILYFSKKEYSKKLEKDARKYMENSVYANLIETKFIENETNYKIKKFIEFLRIKN